MFVRNALTLLVTSLIALTSATLRGSNETVAMKEVVDTPETLQLAGTLEMKQIPVTIYHRIEHHYYKDGSFNLCIAVPKAPAKNGMELKLDVCYGDDSQIWDWDRQMDRFCDRYDKVCIAKKGSSGVQVQWKGDSMSQYIKRTNKDQLKMTYEDLCIATKSDTPKLGASLKVEKCSNSKRQAWIIKEEGPRQATESKTSVV